MKNKNGKILIADDDPVSVKVIVDSLERAGYATQSVDNGQAAWELLEQNPTSYAVVIVDRLMIGVDGMMLLDRIKTAPHLEKIPVIMQTGEAEFEEHVNAVRAGVFDFIYKPVSEELLLFVVGNAINEDL